MTAIDPGRATPAQPATASDPVALPLLTGPDGRLTAVTVNLLPPEVVTARSARKARRGTFVALLVLALVLGAVSVLSRIDVGAARDDLAAADGLSAGLRAQQGRYADVVALQGQVDDAAGRLAQVTTGDLAWAPLLTAVYAAAPAGVAVLTVDGAEDAGVPPVVTLTLTGTATSTTVVAAFADALAGVPGLANVAVTDVTADDEGAYTYGVSAAVTAAAALPTPTTTGGR